MTDEDFNRAVDGFVQSGCLEIAAAALLNRYEPPGTIGCRSYRSLPKRAAAYLERADRGEVPPLPTVEHIDRAALTLHRITFK